MKIIEVFGPGCPKCTKLAKTVETAAQDAGVEVQLIKVTDIAEIVAKGVMMTPGLAIDGKLVSVGKVPSPAEISAWLSAD